MFVKAIQEVIQFTRPVHTISRAYQSDEIIPGAATFFFVNEEAVAITCKHVAGMLGQAAVISNGYNNFLTEMRAVSKNAGQYKNKIKAIEKKYGLSAQTTIQLKYNFLNTVTASGVIDTIPHPTYDLAILKFKNYGNKLYTSHATFVRDTQKIQQGKSLCRLGFPFPVFDNFKLNAMIDDIEWTATGTISTPIFPMDGIITRLYTETSPTLANPIPKMHGIELSTPGLMGQSGGPLFDTGGLIYGMQSSTGHLHLGFDIKDREVRTADGKKTKVNNYHPFLHVGQCIHVDVIKDFLKQNNIKYYEGD